MSKAKVCPSALESITDKEFEELCSAYVEPGAFAVQVPDVVEMRRLPKEAWKMHVTDSGELMVRNWYAPAVVCGWSFFTGDYSGLPDDEITVADLERHGIVIETIDGRTVFKKIV